ncbi:MAG: Gfo/Idh/MocA family oxidoreductase [Gemmatimonadetes bacterium]|nr:Gfo/Idh/MocA family oxidoreductase [Gemmatimonadota bacterium]MYD25604.1 Gfo/Idh/MocA family oxidoreductase [Gemmatimonadota bacterium]
MTKNQAMTQKENAIRFGVVGCGGAGHAAIRSACASTLLDVVAISDLIEERLNRVGREDGIPRLYGPYQDLLADKDVEAVLLAVNPPARYPMVLDAIAAGKHVLVQKPHATRADHILTFKEAAERAGVTMQFCFFMRHAPVNRRTRVALSRGRIGEPYHARIFLKYNHRAPLDSPEAWTHVFGQKGGALGQHASHELDLAWWWMGCPDPQWAFAAKHVVEALYDGPEGPAEDYFSGIAGFEGGKTIQIDCSRWVHCDTPTVVEVYGSEGAYSHGQLWQMEDGVFTSREIDDESDVPHSDPPKDGLPFFHEVEHFARAVAGRVKPDVNANDAYRYMQLLDAMYDSAKTGEKVHIG